MTTVGEPIEPEVWRWYYDVVGKREAVIVDTWWQTENGGFLCSTKPAPRPDEAGQRRPGHARHLSGDLRREGRGGRRAGPARRATSASAIRGPASSRRSGATATGSSGSTTRSTARTRRARTGATGRTSRPTARSSPPDGYFRILGRVDDVINVAGHRLGTKELESACLTVAGGRRGRGRPGRRRRQGPRSRGLHRAEARRTRRSKEITDKVVATIETMIGKIARPRKVHIVPDMPKTRSGKIMRRVLAAISNTLDTGDITTLANPDVVEQIRVAVQGKEKRGDEGRAGRPEAVRQGRVARLGSGLRRAPVPSPPTRYEKGAAHAGPRHHAASGDRRLAGETSLRDAYRTMQREGIRHLPVVQGDAVVGVVTDRDLRLATSSLAAGAARARPPRRRSDVSPPRDGRPRRPGRGRRAHDAAEEDRLPAGPRGRASSPGSSRGSICSTRSCG